MKKSTKTTCLHLLVVLCALCPEIYGQHTGGSIVQPAAAAAAAAQFNTNFAQPAEMMGQPIAAQQIGHPMAQTQMAYPMAQPMGQPQMAYPIAQQMGQPLAHAVPQPYYDDDMYPQGPAVRGFNNAVFAPSNYYGGPVHGQYWTGNPMPYMPHPAAQYQSPGGYYPQPAYPQQYGAAYYGAHPGFDAQYWMGGHQAQQYYGRPAYHHGAPMYYQGGPMMHPGAYYGGYPPMYRKQGFFGGRHGTLKKTLLGAVVVGAVAGAVARGK